MSDGSAGAPEQQESRSEANPPEQESIGARLRRAREAQGRTVRAVAASLNLSVDKVEALEQGDDGRLPPPTFIRGYLRNYARLVGLDPEDTVAAYNRERGGAAEEQAPVIGTVGDPSLEPRPSRKRPRRRALVVVLALALIAVLALLLALALGIG